MIKYKYGTITGNTRRPLLNRINPSFSRSNFTGDGTEPQTIPLVQLQEDLEAKKVKECNLSFQNPLLITLEDMYKSVDADPRKLEKKTKYFCVDYIAHYNKRGTGKTECSPFAYNSGVCENCRLKNENVKIQTYVNISNKLQTDNTTALQHVIGPVFSEPIPPGDWVLHPIYGLLENRDEIETVVRAIYKEDYALAVLRLLFDEDPYVASIRKEIEQTLKHVALTRLDPQMTVAIGYEDGRSEMINVSQLSLYDVRNISYFPASTVKCSTDNSRYHVKSGNLNIRMIPISKLKESSYRLNRFYPSLKDCQPAKMKVDGEEEEGEERLIACLCVTGPIQAGPPRKKQLSTMKEKTSMSLPSLCDHYAARLTAVSGVEFNHYIEMPMQEVGDLLELGLSKYEFDTRETKIQGLLYRLKE